MKSKHVHRTKKLSNTPTHLSLLRLVDPASTQVLNLDDMVSTTQKNLLKRLPSGPKENCHKLFQEYILKYKSFRLPIETFLHMYS